MAEKRTALRAKEFWANVTNDVEAYLAGADEASVFLANLKEAKDEPTHEV